MLCVGFGSSFYVRMRGFIQGKICFEANLALVEKVPQMLQTMPDDLGRPLDDPRIPLAVTVDDPSFLYV